VKLPVSGDMVSERDQRQHNRIRNLTRSQVSHCRLERSTSFRRGTHNDTINTLQMIREMFQNTQKDGNKTAHYDILNIHKF